MSNQNQTKFSQKISTPIGILIIVVLAVLVGGIVIWQSKWETPTPKVLIEIPPRINCSALEKEIEQEIIEANYCQRNEDCVISYFSCPFGCYSLINKEEKEKLQEKINRYQKEYKGICPLCEYKCPRFSGEVGCINNKCLPKITEEMKKCDKDIDCTFIARAPLELLCKCINKTYIIDYCPLGLGCAIDECAPNCKCLNGLCGREEK